MHEPNHRSLSQQQNARLTSCKTAVCGNAPYGENVMESGAAQGTLNMPPHRGTFL